MALEVVVRTWKRSDRSKLARWPEPDLPAHWRKGIESPGQRASWAIDAAGHLVGRITLRGYNPLTRTARIGIYLHPHWYGQGIGTLALTQFVVMAHCGVDYYRLDVAEDNLRARRCYEKCGFVQVAKYGILVEMERDAPRRVIANNTFSVSLH